MAGNITVAPANAASEADLEAVFATAGDPRRCWCQWFKTDTNGWSRNSVAQRRALLLEQAAPGQPDAATTGLVAHVDGVPAGWVAVEPRTAYQRLLRSRTVWKGRDEDRADDGVWAITCYVVVPEFRGRGVMEALTRAAVEHARRSGARAVEAYPRVLEPGARCSEGELYVGLDTVLRRCGFETVSTPSATRAVLRHDLRADA